MPLHLVAALAATFVSMAHVPAATSLRTAVRPVAFTGIHIVDSQLAMVDHEVVPSAQVALSGALCFLAIRATSWQPASVRFGLALLSIVDFGPTARRQLSEADSAVQLTLAERTAARSDRRRPGRHVAHALRITEAEQAAHASERWQQLVRAKVFGEIAGLLVALRRPCAGASLLLSSHLGFWALGAARARVDAAGRAAPLPPPLVKVIATADAVVLLCALLGSLGPNPALRSAGSALFSAAALLVCLEQVPKWLKRRRAVATASAPPASGGLLTVEDLPDVSVKSSPASRFPRSPQMLTTAPAYLSPRSPELSVKSSPASRAPCSPRMLTTAITEDRSTSEGSAISARDAIWAEAWYPLAFAAHTTKTAPVAVQVRFDLLELPLSSL